MTNRLRRSSGPVLNQCSPTLCQQSREAKRQKTSTDAEVPAARSRNGVDPDYRRQGSQVLVRPVIHSVETCQCCSRLILSQHPSMPTCPLHRTLSTPRRFLFPIFPVPPPPPPNHAKRKPGPVFRGNPMLAPQTFAALQQRNALLSSVSAGYGWGLSPGLCTSAGPGELRWKIALNPCQPPSRLWFLSFWCTPQVAVGGGFRHYWLPSDAGCADRDRRGYQGIKCARGPALAPHALKPQPLKKSARACNLRRISDIPRAGMGSSWPVPSRGCVPLQR